MKSTLLKYDMFLTLAQSSSLMEGGIFQEEDVILESKSSGIRILDYFEKNDMIEEDLELHLLTEDEKWEVENKLWEGVHFFATNDSKLHEGFWSDFIGGVRSLTKKGAQAAKMFLQGIGNVLKMLAKYAVEFYKVCKEKAKEAAKALWSTIKAPIDKRLEDKMGKYTEEEMEKEADEWSETVNWIVGKSTDAGLATGAAEAKKAAAEIEKEDGEERKELLQKVIQKEKTAKNESEEIYINRAITRTINEIRSSDDFDHKDLLEYGVAFAGIEGMFRAELNLNEFDDITTEHVESLSLNENIFKKISNWSSGKGWTADKEKEAEERTEKKVADTEVPQLDSTPKDAAEEKAKKWYEKITLGGTIMKLVQLLVSGVAAIFAWIAEFLFKKAFKSISVGVKSVGGPGVYTFAVTSALLAVGLELIVEFGLEPLAKWTESETLHKIAEGLHHINPVYYILHKGAGHAADLILPGASTMISVGAKVVCLSLALYHAIHSIAHHRGEIDHEKAEEVDKEAISAIDKRLGEEGVADDEKAFLEDQKRLREAKLRAHKELKRLEHDIHELPSKIADAETEEEKKKLKDSKKNLKEDSKTYREELTNLNNQYLELQAKYTEKKLPKDYTFHTHK